MKWLLVNVVVLCLVLCGCKTKVRTLDYLQSNQTHWGEYVNTGHTLSDEIEEIWVNPAVSLRGDSVTVPPCPPATPFHYVWLPPSEAPKPVPLVPAFVRKVHKASVDVDTARSSAVTTEVVRRKVSKVSKPIKDWLTFVKTMAFVVVICLLVYFVFRRAKNSTTLHRLLG